MKDDILIQMKSVDQTKSAPIPGNTINTFNDAGSTYAAMIKDIDEAQTSVYFANFCFQNGREFNRMMLALKAAAERGVDVRVLADAYGSRDISSEQAKSLEQLGIRWVWFRPFVWYRFWRYNRRMHKKLLIIDGQIGYTGGMGVADFWAEATPGYPAAWRDSHFRLTGPIISAMHQSFAYSWRKWSKVPVADLESPAPSGKISMAAVESGPLRGINPVGELYSRLIDMAKSSITITTAYLGPDQRLRSALLKAAGRGVEIRLLVNGRFTTHSYAAEAGRHWYRPLLKAGIQIFEYQPTKVHSKLMTIDHRLTTIGSANFNFRSFHHDEEFNIVIDDAKLSKSIERQFSADIEQAASVTTEAWKQRPKTRALKQYLLSRGRYFF